MSKLVDQGSFGPSSRASKYTVLPSGDQVYSLSSPSGLEGTSASRPWLSQVGSPVSLPSVPKLAAKSCERRPSIHTFQWRMKSWSYTLPLDLLAALSSKRVLVQAR